MKRVAVSQLKNRLSEYLRLVKRGETIEILERSVPIARIEGLNPRTSAAGPRNEQFERLVRAGLIKSPKQKLDVKAFLAMPLVPCSVDAVKILIEERGDR